ncbi:helix-turn-helix domain-containing protein [Actinoplanes derwentensis]|uniref:helix-turn-helix domain-containing protein n=1 Tax=Actinoplanes derwentensis TaxID=113562 RepID=UPI000B03EF4A|nr:helix-turn-helix domain-containing protein [Actinoplanes derwentensis]
MPKAPRSGRGRPGGPRDGGLRPPQRRRPAGQPTLPLSDLAATAGVSERTLTRLFTTATGRTPLRYQQLLRVERAEHLIGHGATTDSAARAVGFTDARMLRRLRSRAPAE